MRHNLAFAGALALASTVARPPIRIPYQDLLTSGRDEPQQSSAADLEALTKAEAKRKRKADKWRAEGR